ELLDAEEIGGQLTEFEDEPAIIQPVTKGSFEDIAIAFFASSPAFTRNHWQLAESSGCHIIDLSYVLDTHPQARLRAPLAEKFWTDEPGARGDTRPQTISVSAHPAAVAIAGILTRLSPRFTVKRAVITVYEPVSEHGKAGVDELHQQTVNLFAFQKIT